MNFILVFVLLFAQAAPCFAQESTYPLLAMNEVNLTAEPVDFLSYQAIEHKGKIYNLSLEEKDYAPAKELTVGEMEKFLIKRERILAKFVAVLSVTKVFVGAGAVIKNKLIFWKPEQRSLSEVYKTSAHKVTERVLTMLDKQLWETAKVVASSNETSFVFLPRLIAGLGFKDKGLIPSLGLGFGFVINHERNEFIFEIFSSYGKFDRTLFPIPSGGAKLMFMTGLRLSTDLAGTAQRPKTTMVFLPGPLVVSKATHEVGFYADPGLGLGLFMMLAEIKEHKLLSFSLKLRDKKLPDGIRFCRQVHL